MTETRTDGSTDPHAADTQANASSEPHTAETQADMSDRTHTTETATPQSPPESTTLVKTILARELDTVLLQPSFAGFLVVMTLIIFGLAWTGGGIGAGYVPTVVDLLTPLEVLVPLLAVALGYRAIQNDERRGELEVLETYPVAAWQVIAGIYLGRAFGVVLALAVPLLLLMLPIAAVGGPVPLIYATHSGADSPWLYLRFVVLTILFALVLLAVAMAVSALVSTTRTAVAAGTVTLVVLLFGLDIAIVYGFDAGFLDASSLIHSLALSPLSAYRGLVLETAITVASGTGPQTASPLASAVGLAVWGVTSIYVATRAIQR